MPISGSDQRRVGGEPGELDAGLRAGPLDAERVVEHRDAVEVAGLAEQFAAPVDHRLDVLVAQLRGLLDAPLERLVVVADELQVDAERYLAHVAALGTTCHHRIDSLFISRSVAQSPSSWGRGPHG